MGINVNIYNIILFNAGWLACVLGGNTVAILATCAITWLHIQHISGNNQEWLWLALISSCGFAFDTALFLLGILEHPQSLYGEASGVLPPVWMICLWWLFATTLCHSMQWFSERLHLAFIGGAVAGPMSYHAGAQLSDVSLATGVIPLVTLSLFWGAFLPLVIWGASRFQRHYGFA